jgi:NAD(P)-dependent dehydrogenase (short-subunit alcohol dehydrogenase family)
LFLLTVAQLRDVFAKIRAQHTKLVETAAAAWGRIDCVVNNAGVGVAQRGDLLEVTSESFGC